MSRMTELEIADAATKLNKAAGLFALRHVTMFEARRTSRDGTAHRVNVSILDSGTTVDPRLRYAVEAVRADGKGTSGDPAPSVAEAIAAVHWADLDEPARFSFGRKSAAG
jgi:hypothetical protein